jgi:predicted glycosyltransferase
MTVKALVYVQHLLGIGHLARIYRIANALCAAGVHVTVAQGGPATNLTAGEGVNLVQLTPVKVASDDMSTLLHVDGKPFTDADKAARRDHLLSLLTEIRPDMLVLEAFPFGRRQMRFELLPLLDEAKRLRVPIIAASIRDLLQESRKAGRAEETIKLVNDCFDMVLVHGNGDFTPLSKTFPLANLIAERTFYTGVVGPVFPQTISNEYAVIVSAGGGAVGEQLLEAAILSATMSPFRNEPWLVLAGLNLPQPAFEKLQALAALQSTKIKIARSVPDLAACLAGARVSVSQAGYNTVSDILVAGCAAVLVPFATGGETEQTMRAEALESSGRAVVISEDKLTPESLAMAIQRSVLLPQASLENLDGGTQTATLLLDALKSKRASEKLTGFRQPSKKSFTEAAL